MRVHAVEVFDARLPLVHEFETSSYRKDYLQHLLVRVTADDGRVGWGEIASPSVPFYCAEWVDSCWEVAGQHLVPALLGASWTHPRQACELWAKVRGNEFAKAGLDMACWDLWAKANDLSLASALGGTRTSVVAGVSLGIEPTVGELVTQVAAQVAAGYPRVKLKIAPGWDVEPVHAVRAEFPDLMLHVDANGAYTEHPDHLSALRALDSAGLSMIEQPFAPRNLVAHADLQRDIQTPVCLDESVVEPHDLRSALALGAVRILNIKVSRMGGLTAALAAHDLAHEHGIEVWCGGMHEFGIGRAANIALSSLPGFALPSDVSGSDKYYRRDVIDPPVTAVNGSVAVPTAAGIGHAVDAEFIAEIAVRSQRWEA